MEVGWNRVGDGDTTVMRCHARRLFEVQFVVLENNKYQWLVWYGSAPLAAGVCGVGNDGTGHLVQVFSRHCALIISDN